MKSYPLVTTLALSAVLVLSILASSPQPVEARPVCPTDGIVHETSGSVGLGASCNEAYSNLVAQEWPKMNCPYGLYDYAFHSNSCQWNGTAYQATGWYEYRCQTDCYGVDP